MKRQDFLCVCTLPEFAERMTVPGATTSGFRRILLIGPWLLKALGFGSLGSRELRLAPTVMQILAAASALMSFVRTNQWLRAIIPCRKAYDDIWVFTYELVDLPRAAGVIHVPDKAWHGTRYRFEILSDPLKQHRHQDSTDVF